MMLRRSPIWSRATTQSEQTRTRFSAHGEAGLRKIPPESRSARGPNRVAPSALPQGSPAGRRAQPIRRNSYVAIHRVLLPRSRAARRATRENPHGRAADHHRAPNLGHQSGQASDFANHGRSHPRSYQPVRRARDTLRTRNRAAFGPTAVHDVPAHVSPAHGAEPRPLASLAEVERCAEHCCLATLSQAPYEKALKAAIHLAFGIHVLSRSKSEEANEPGVP